MSAELTPSQTVGPFHHYALPRPEGFRIATEATKGQAFDLLVWIHDGQNAPVDDALVEIWQADAAGRYNHPEDRRNEPLDPGFTGFGRVTAGEDGSYLFRTVKPGRVPAPEGGLQAPHLNLTIFARGLLNRLITRVYFDDEAEANLQDMVLNSLIEPERRQTMMARKGGDPGTYVVHIHLQGPRETVFFEI